MPLHSAAGVESNESAMMAKNAKAFRILGHYCKLTLTFHIYYKWLSDLKLLKKSGIFAIIFSRHNLSKSAGRQ